MNSFSMKNKNFSFWLFIWILINIQNVNGMQSGYLYDSLKEIRFNEIKWSQDNKPLDISKEDISKLSKEKKITLKKILLADEIFLEENYPIYKDVLLHANETNPKLKAMSSLEGGYYPKRSNGYIFESHSCRIHEVEHMLNYQIIYNKRNQSELQGLYYGNNHGIVFKKPALTVGDIKNKVPLSMKTEFTYNPYQEYIESSDKQDRNISYLFDEWMAYIVNARLLLSFEKNKYSEKNGYSANHAPYFFGFLATGMNQLRAQNKLLDNPETKQFKATFALLAEATWDIMCKSFRIESRYSQCKLSNGACVLDTLLYSILTLEKQNQKLMTYYKDSVEFLEIRLALTEIYGSPWMSRLMQCEHRHTSAYIFDYEHL